jgi:hypothetical protein
LGYLQVHGDTFPGDDGRTAPVEQHQTNNGESPEGAEAAPELSHLRGGERLDETVLLLEPQAAGDDAPRPA